MIPVGGVKFSWPVAREKLTEGVTFSRESISHGTPELVPGSIGYHLLPGTMKVVPQKRPPIVLRTVMPLRMGYACSSIEILTQQEILSHLKKKITKIDALEAFKWKKSATTTYVYICGRHGYGRTSGSSDGHRK